MRFVTFTADNDVSLLHCGGEYFPALIKAFDGAEHQILFETYIFAADTTGILVRDALIRAARRGVEVHVITDWHGTGPVQTAALNKAFADGDVQHRAFNPWFRQGIGRTHRKMCTVDGKIAFIGGLNVVDDLCDDDDPSIKLPEARWDFAVRVEGPLARAIGTELAAQWTRLGGRDLKERWKSFRRFRKEGKKTPLLPTDRAQAGLIVRDNLRNRRTILKAYLQMLGQARHCVMIANPYFAPGRKLRNALVAAARRGVDVTLLLGYGQYSMQDLVAHSYYPGLLAAGVKIVEYRRTQLHAKVALVDDTWATIGSSNCDGLSMFVNQEANVVLRDPKVSRDLRRHLEHGIAQGIPVSPSEFARRPWYQRVKYTAAFILYAGILRAITLGKYG
jgi:cardiolipin synthase